VEFTKEADIIVAASLLHTSSSLTYKQCKRIVKTMSQTEQMSFFKSAWRNLQFYDSMLREFEYVNLTFNIVASAACFGQLKRHRMSTITAQNYDPNIGITIPESIKEISMVDYFRDLIDKTNDTYDKIAKKVPLAAAYILTNAHRKQILIRINARELYHVSRLREDSHAQWDIQNISRQMTDAAKKVMPLVFAFVGGKDKYNDIYQSIYGKLPKITESQLPGQRTIK
jgi:thymidylate synthase ThyX